MENVVQIKIDEKRKEKASSIFSKNNLTLPSAIRLFVNRSIENNSIPVSLLMPKESDMDKNAIKALREMQLISALNGNSEMSLDEINAEISASRQGLWRNTML